MASSTDINGISKPQLSDIANIETATHAALDAIDLQLPSRFASVSARDSTIVSPLPGMISFVTATNELYVYDGTYWVSLRPRLFYHSVTQAFSSTTKVDITGLTVPLEANSKYIITGSIVVSTDRPTEDNDIEFAWSIPSGLTGDWILRSGPVTEAGTQYHDNYRVRNLEWSTACPAATKYTLYLRYEVEGVAISTNAGSLVMRAGESTAAAGNAYVMQDSYLKVEKVA